MPRPKPPRAIFAEANLARRIAAEREQRGWTYKDLAEKLDSVGCRIQISALHKIEKGDPPRRITFDEVVAFSLVFGVPINDLAADPSSLISSRAVDLSERNSLAWARYTAARRVAERLREEAEELITEYNDYIKEHPDVAASVNTWLGPQEQMQATFNVAADVYEEEIAKAIQRALPQLRTTRAE